MLQALYMGPLIYLSINFFYLFCLCSIILMTPHLMAYLEGILFLQIWGWEWLPVSQTYHFHNFCETKYYISKCHYVNTFRIMKANAQVKFGANQLLHAHVGTVSVHVKDHVSQRTSTRKRQGQDIWGQSFSHSVVWKGVVNLSPTWIPGQETPGKWPKARIQQVYV